MSTSLVWRKFWPSITPRYKSNILSYYCAPIYILLSIIQATQVFCEQLLELHRGQGMEIYWRDSYICPTEDEYRQMIIRSE